MGIFEMNGDHLWHTLGPYLTARIVFSCGYEKSSRICRLVCKRWNKDLRNLERDIRGQIVSPQIVSYKNMIRLTESDPNLIIYVMDECRYCREVIPILADLSVRLKLLILVVERKTIPIGNRPRGYPHIFIRNPICGDFLFEERKRDISSLIRFIEQKVGTEYVRMG